MMIDEDDMQILITEYRYLLDQLANIQRISERQETIFITLVTAVISALLILGTAIQAGFGELQVVHVG